MKHLSDMNDKDDVIMLLACDTKLKIGDNELVAGDLMYLADIDSAITEFGLNTMAELAEESFLAKSRYRNSGRYSSSAAPTGSTTEKFSIDGVELTCELVTHMVYDISDRHESGEILDEDEEELLMSFMDGSITMDNIVIPARYRGEFRDEQQVMKDVSRKYDVDEISITQNNDFCSIFEGFDGELSGIIFKGLTNNDTFGRLVYRIHHLLFSSAKHISPYSRKIYNSFKMFDDKSGMLKHAMKYNHKDYLDLPLYKVLCILGYTELTWNNTLSRMCDNSVIVDLLSVRFSK